MVGLRQALESLEEAQFDVAVIGAGINGASTAEQLSAAGYRVLIVDKSDFATGASARSSRLLHCGLRYLAPGRSVFDFIRHPSRLRVATRMARQAMQARSEFVKLFPERMSPMRLHFPIWRGGQYKGWQVDFAFRLLEALGPGDLPLDYRRLTRDEAAKVPLVAGLRDFDRLGGVAAYREYQFHWPERIAIDAVERAEANGAVARNYTSARMLAHDGQGWRIELTDMLAQSPPVTVRAKMTLLMAGTWIDEVAKGGSSKAGRKIFGTKGCHIVVQLPPECRGIGVATYNSVGEPLYCIPWKHLHYFGPTETEYTGDLDRIHVTDAEQAGLIREANILLPGLNLKPSDILMTWAGVRPLTYDPAVPFGNRSREVHDLGPDGLPDALAMTAGPVMTHRSAGAEMVARVGQALGAPDPARRPPATRPAPAAHAQTLSDMLFRRTDRAWSGPVDEAELDALAAETAALLGWDETRARNEKRAFEDEWARLYRARAHA
jgi:glycerol-3-phosphate dehydrogenase